MRGMDKKQFRLVFTHEYKQRNNLGLGLSLGKEEKLVMSKV